MRVTMNELLTNNGPGKQCRGNTDKVSFHGDY